MLGRSFTSSPHPHHHHQDQDQEPAHHHHHQHQEHQDQEPVHHLHHQDQEHQDQDQEHHHHDPSFPLPMVSSDLCYCGGGGGGVRQLLLRCAELISRSDFSAARRLLSFLSANSSPFGDSTDRLAHHFTRALSLRLTRLTTTTNNDANTSSTMINTTTSIDTTSSTSYLSLNQITPFVRFSHLTANQAILEAVAGHEAVHILDFDIMHGVQWPPLLQALASLSPQPAVRITATAHDASLLRLTGDRLLSFARSLGLPSFHFHPLLLPHNDQDHDHDDQDDHNGSVHAMVFTSLVLRQGESLAVNCSLYLHRLLRDGSSRGLHLFLLRIRALNPIIVAVAEREARHNQALFLERFGEALEHYRAVFESLEATLPPSSAERMSVEEVWFGSEIEDVVAAEGGRRRERHERFGEFWEGAMRRAGFLNVPVSPFAVSQAKLLLRLHYPSEGYQIKTLRNAIFLGWHQQSLFSVSSWSSPSSSS